MRKIIYILFLFGCGNGETVFVPVTPVAPVDQYPDDTYPQDDSGQFPDDLPTLPEDEGESLYLQKCASCHGKNPDIAGYNAAQIREALRTVRAMFNVKASIAEQQKIGIFLTELASSGNPGNPGNQGDDDGEGEGEGEGEEESD